MGEKEKQLNAGHDPDATVVNSIFGGEATVVAQPVVPLDDKTVAEDVVAYVNTGNAPPVYTRAWKRRTQMTVALVLAALFLGTVVGVLGLRLYQRSRAADSANTVTEPTQATTEVPRAATESTAQVGAGPERPQLKAELPVVTVSESEVVEAAAREVKTEVKTAAPVRAAERAAARDSSATDERAVPVKRGKKGESESERVRPPVHVGREPEPEFVSPEAERRALREEQRLRRAEKVERREQRRARRVDSVRGIFEGRNESPPR